MTTPIKTNKDLLREIRDRKPDNIFVFVKTHPFKFTTPNGKTLTLNMVCVRVSKKEIYGRLRDNADKDAYWSIHNADDPVYPDDVYLGTGPQV